MRNPVNRLATAAPRAFDSILKPTSSTTTSTTTTDSTNTENEKRSRGASFHMMDLSVLLNTDTNDENGSSITAPQGSVGDETGSVLTFDAIQNSTSLDCGGWGWNDKGEVGL